MPRLHRATSPAASCNPSVLADFYRQELLKHRDCLELQREYYSDRAITEAEEGLMRLLAQLDQLCTKEYANELVADILRQYDVVTRLSALTDQNVN